MVEPYTSTYCRLDQHEDCQVTRIVPNCPCPCHTEDDVENYWVVDE